MGFKYLKGAYQKKSEYLVFTKINECENALKLKQINCLDFQSRKKFHFN